LTPKKTVVKNANMGAKRDKTPKKAESVGSDGEEAAPVTPPRQKPTEAPVVKSSAPEPVETMIKTRAELHMYDMQSGAFVLQDNDVIAEVTDVGNWNYWMQISSSEREWLGIPIEPELTPVFNFEFLSCIFNHFHEDGNCYSWLLRFKDQNVLEAFQNGLMTAMWEKLNQMKYAKLKQSDQDYLVQQMNDLEMTDAPEEEEEEIEERRIESETESESEDDEPAPSKPSRYEDDDESEQSDEEDDKDVNSQLAVGYKNDRSFVVRGSKIGVFRHTPNDKLEFSTNISQVKTPGGKLFSPKKVMLHNQDSSMIIQDEANPHKLFRMDLEHGKIVDEWNVHDDIAVKSFAPATKFAQMDPEQTFLGLSKNALFRVDPRVSGNKLVDSSLQQYAATSRQDFTAAATTSGGNIAVANSKGEIKLFDRLGIRAKTSLPALGDPIINIDTTADGRWLLATTATYLLLIDTMQKDGKNEGVTGFLKSFAADKKPAPRRLALKPEHVAQFAHETGPGSRISFTPAKFNTSLDGTETTIVTATGPFVITWNMKKVIKGQRDQYSIKRYEEKVMADEFRFGSDRNVIVALPNEVNMVKRTGLKRPTRESIMLTPQRRESGRVTRRGASAYKLGRDDIVNSPY
jgi:hypothetical protein